MTDLLMDTQYPTRLCRICGTTGSQYVHIFRTDGLRHKIETCLPIIVSEHSLLPDTICNNCNDNVENFYRFVKNCLENLLVLEAQLNITQEESSFKSQRKSNKSCWANISTIAMNQSTQTDPYLDALLLEAGVVENNVVPLAIAPQLVSYDLNDDSTNDNNDDDDDDDDGFSDGNVVIVLPSNSKTVDNNTLINEIYQRKQQIHCCADRKRKSSPTIGVVSCPPKICKIPQNKRKSSQPKRLTGVFCDNNTKCEDYDLPLLTDIWNQSTTLYQQTCLFCKLVVPSIDELIQHVYEMHDIDTLPLHNGMIRNSPNLVVKNNDNEELQFQPDPVSICSECGLDGFNTFMEYSAHRRCVHSIFHCDLCNKFYGRNSHLWKHVNRVHKGHPSITCQICYKTSASKYHLEQHFNKIHNTNKQEQSEHFLQKKFQGFDFQSVKQSFMRQELLEQQQSTEPLPKEIDATSDLYTNIITNYTPPQNDGDFKCSKCGKGFVKKALLKKHRKNCRPRLQKDLLTRCTSCARIFKDRQSLTKHLINYHSNYTCEICQQQVQSKCEIVSHIRFSHPNSELVCKLCDNILRCLQDLKTHTSDHQNSYICQFCGDSLPSKIKLKMHILSLHRKILSLSCGVCLKLFESQQILRDHVRLVHSNELKPLTSCPVCGKNYGSKWKTFDHLSKSHGRHFKACKMCLDVFTTEDGLKLHYQNVHCKSDSAVDAVLNETENNKVKNRLKRMANHTVDGGEPVQINMNTSKRTVYVNSDTPSFCEICSKTWPAKRHLWQHYIRCHKSVAATVCGICLKTNSSYKTLQRHLHENHPTLLHGQGFGSNFICRICGRYHNARSKLRLHMAIHDNFDWSILETNTNQNDEETSSCMEPEPRRLINGDDPIINYDSLIEKVECSDSNTDAEDSDDEDPDEEEESSSGEEEEEEGDDDDDDDDEDDNEEDTSNESENSLETQMLQNMLREKDQIEQTQINLPSDDGLPMTKSPKLSSDDDNDDDDDDDLEDLSSSESNSITLDSKHPEILNCKMEELDSAIQSIKYESDLDDGINMKVEPYCEFQSVGNSLNEHEIESAVGSIL